MFFYINEYYYYFDILHFYGFGNNYSSVLLDSKSGFIFYFTGDLGRAIITALIIIRLLAAEVLHHFQDYLLHLPRHPFQWLNRVKMFMNQMSTHVQS